MFNKKTLYRLHTIAYCLVAIPFTGCMFSDQDAADFEAMMTPAEPQQASPNNTCTPDSSTSCTNTNPPDTGNNETEQGNINIQMPKDSGLNDSLIRNYCQYYGANPTTEQTICYKQIIQLALNYPKCVEQEEAYYRCANTSPYQHISSRNPYDIKNFLLKCENEELNPYQSIDDCLSNQIIDCLNLPSFSYYGFGCQNEQTEYDDCMSLNYQVTPELFYRK